MHNYTKTSAEWMQKMPQSIVIKNYSGWEKSSSASPLESFNTELVTMDEFCARLARSNVSRRHAATDELARQASALVAAQTTDSIEMPAQ